MGAQRWGPWGQGNQPAGSMGTLLAKSVGGVVKVDNQLIVSPRG